MNTYSIPPLGEGNTLIFITQQRGSEQTLGSLPKFFIQLVSFIEREGHIYSNHLTIRKGVLDGLRGRSLQVGSTTIGAFLFDLTD